MYLDYNSTTCNFGWPLDFIVVKHFKQFLKKKITIDVVQFNPLPPKKKQKKTLSHLLKTNKNKPVWQMYEIIVGIYLRKYGSGRLR